MSFGWTAANLPDKVKRLLSAEDRKALGKAGETTEEALRRAAIKTEKDLQNVIEQWLRMKGFEPIRARMDVPTTNNKGCPDILLAVRHPEVVLGGGSHAVFALAIEVKLPGEKLSDDQEQMRARMIYPPNGWRHVIVYSLDDVIEIIKWCGIN